jgi:hypothetical protein
MRIRRIPQLPRVVVRHGQVVRDSVWWSMARTQTNRYEASAGNGLPASIPASCVRQNVSIGRRNRRIQRKQYKRTSSGTVQVRYDATYERFAGPCRVSSPA